MWCVVDRADIFEMGEESGVRNRRMTKRMTKKGSKQRGKKGRMRFLYIQGKQSGEYAVGTRKYTNAVVF